MLSGSQHGGREYDDLQNWFDMMSHENPLLYSKIFQFYLGMYLCEHFFVSCIHHSVTVMHAAVLYCRKSSLSLPINLNPTLRMDVTLPLHARQLFNHIFFVVVRVFSSKLTTARAFQFFLT